MMSLFVSTLKSKTSATLAKFLREGVDGIFEVSLVDRTGCHKEPLYESFYTELCDAMEDYERIELE